MDQKMSIFFKRFLKTKMTLICLQKAQYMYIKLKFISNSSHFR